MKLPRNWKPRSKQRGFIQFLPLIGAGLGLLSSRKQPDQQTTSQGGMSTSVQTNQLNPALMQGVSNAMGGLNRLPNYSVAELPSQFYQAGNQANRLSQFTPSTSIFSSGGPTNDVETSSGFASGEGQNQFLQSAFDRAANLSQPRIASEFARAGRQFGSGAQQALRADELGAISANLMLPLAEAERSRQFGAAEAGVERSLAQREANLGRQFSATEGDLGRSLQGANINLAALGPMANIALTRQGVEQQKLDAPFMDFTRYLSGIQGLAPFFPSTQTQTTNQSGTVTQPLFKDPLSSALGGAILGSNIMGSFGNKTTPNNWGAPQNSTMFNPYSQFTNMWS